MGSKTPYLILTSLTSFTTFLFFHSSPTKLGSLPQDVCTCCFLCMKPSFPRYLMVPPSAASGLCLRIRGLVCFSSSLVVVIFSHKLFQYCLWPIFSVLSFWDRNYCKSFGYVLNISYSFFLCFPPFNLTMI